MGLKEDFADSAKRNVALANIFALGVKKKESHSRLYRETKESPFVRLKRGERAYVKRISHRAERQTYSFDGTLQETFFKSERVAGDATLWAFKAAFLRATFTEDERT